MIVLPADDGFLRAWQEYPAGPAPLIWSDWLEDAGQTETAHLLRALVRAWQTRTRGPMPPKRKSGELWDTKSWEDAIDKLAPEWRSVFAAGCVIRCALWMPAECRTKQAQNTRDLLEDLTIPPWSDAAESRAVSAWALASVTRRTYNSYPNIDTEPRIWALIWAVGARAETAWARANEAASVASAARARAWATESRAAAVQAKAAGAKRQADALVRGITAESSWQVHWLQSITAIGSSQ